MYQIFEIIIERSKGTAVITFAYPDFAEEARKKFNGNILIKNVIRVFCIPYFRLKLISISMTKTNKQTFIFVILMKK